ncbi:MAG TPA: Rieske 2Fe-2S domain-containing protein [Candidatus Binatia bacterium]|jgi:nitrite reductase/ring-hydroxylating ferredoxin subunit
MEPSDPYFHTVPPDRGADTEQPRWRSDFPIDAPQDEYIARRDFTKFMVLASLAFVAGQFWILARNLFRRRAATPAREIARIDDIPRGGSLVFDYPEAHQPALLVRLPDGGVVAYDQQCTHLSCPVVPRVSEGKLHCPCHEGSFDLATGKPLAGPPRRPLPRIRLEVRDGRIFAVGVEERAP